MINRIISATALIATTIAFIAITSAKNINITALVCVAFFGAVFYTLYVAADN